MENKSKVLIAGLVMGLGITFANAAYNIQYGYLPDSQVTLLTWLVA